MTRLPVAVAFALLLSCAVPAAPAAPATAGATPAATSAEQLYRDIAQRKDKPLRAARVNELRAWLGGSPRQKQDALAALARLHDVPFDRKPIRPAVLDLFDDEDPDVRAAAVTAIAAAGGDESDLPAIAKLADDPSAKARAKVVGAMVFTGKGEGQELITPVVEKLIFDDADEVQRDTIRALWGNPVSPKVEEKLIQISRGPLDDHRALPYLSVYHGLSTRPVVSLPVAKRLIEIMRDPNSSGDIAGRAAWGLNHPLSPEATGPVVDAMVTELDESLNPYVRQQLMYVLVGHARSPDVRAKLEAIANDPDEDESIRKKAAEALGRR